MQSNGEQFASPNCISSSGKSQASSNDSKYPNSALIHFSMSVAMLVGFGVAEMGLSKLPCMLLSSQEEACCEWVSSSELRVFGVVDSDSLLAGGAQAAAAAAAAACTSRGVLHKGRSDGGDSGKLRVADGPRKHTTAAS